MQEHVVEPRFFVFSDDLNWCRRNLKIPCCELVALQTSGEEPVNDIRLMSLCPHNVIANSTFSWWGAWLNANPEKIVVAPSGGLPMAP